MLDDNYRLGARVRQLSLVVLVAGLPTGALGQVDVSVPDEVVCPQCEITLTPVATLGHLEDDVALSRISEFAVDPGSRRIYAARTYLPGVIAMYDWDGRLLSTFGREGRGPGEFSASQLTVLLMVDAHGDINVIEAGRRTIIRAGLVGLARTYPVPGSFDGATVLGDGQFLVALPPAPDRNPRRFILFDSTGVEVSRFGPAGLADTRLDLHSAPSGTVWAVHTREYRMDEISADGTLLRSVTREAAWFPPWGRESPAAPFSRPTFVGVYEDSDGKVWTLTRVPDANRSDVLAGQTAVRLDELDWNAVQDTRIEVMDLATGVVLARKRYDEALWFIGRGFIVERAQTPRGLIQARISKVSLTYHEEVER